MNQQDSRIRTTASSLIEHLALVTHAEPIADPLGCGGATVSWHITAPYGHGTLWCFSIDDATALFSCDFAVAQAVRTSARALDCFLFGTCTRLPGPRTATSNRVNRAPVGRVQQACAPPPMIDIEANETVETYGIALLPPRRAQAQPCMPLRSTRTHFGDRRTRWHARHSPARQIARRNKDCTAGSGCCSGFLRGQSLRVHSASRRLAGSTHALSECRDEQSRPRCARPRIRPHEGQPRSTRFNRRALPHRLHERNEAHRDIQAGRR